MAPSWEEQRCRLGSPALEQVPKLVVYQRRPKDTCVISLYSCGSWRSYADPATEFGSYLTKFRPTSVSELGLLPGRRGVRIPVLAGLDGGAA